MVIFSYRVSLLSMALLDPVELSERQLGGDRGRQRQLVVGTGSPLQLQTWKQIKKLYYNCQHKILQTWNTLGHVNLKWDDR